MSFISTLRHFFIPQPPLDAQTRAALNKALAVERSLLAVGGAQKKLAAPVRHALDYSHQLAREIPGPIHLDVKSFGADPLVHSLFAAPEDIAHMLGISVEARKLLQAGRRIGDTHVYGMIGVRRKEKVLPGLALHGDRVEEGPPQRVLYFGDHTLHELAADLNQTRDGLAMAAFASLVQSFGKHLESLRQKKNDLRQAWEAQRAQWRAHSSVPASATSAHTGLHTDATTQSLERELLRAAEVLQPAQILDAFAAWLAEPQARLRLDEIILSIDRMGVIRQSNAIAQSPTDAVHTLSLRELVSRDRRRWIVLLARIAASDIADAQRANSAPGRYMII